MSIRALPATATIAVAAFLTACSGSKSSPTPTPTPAPPVPVTFPSGLSSSVLQMLNGLQSYMTSVLAENQSLLPNNPQSQTYIQAKIAALQQPSLYADIVNGRRWNEGQAASSIGPAVPVATVFMLESMRSESGDAVRVIEAALPLLETFFNVRFPTANVRIWYGFKVGNSGGGGQIYTEDRTTYVTRTTASRKPHDAIMMHELSHTYMSNECFNQFLEFYVFNLIATGSTDFSRWTYTQNSLPGVDALFDIYKLIGPDAMRDAYRAVYPLRPPYGSPLSQAVIQAFLSAVPQQHQATVSTKLAIVNF
ncbi:MAG TPA: hypothetical protein VN700_13055 [Vicinamibacterales bacterium]|nr:hypothetical protein [Vicinamibacterales bacterium]